LQVATYSIVYSCVSYKSSSLEVARPAQTMLKVRDSFSSYRITQL